MSRRIGERSTFDKEKQDFLRLFLFRTHLGVPLTVFEQQELAPPEKLIKPIKNKSTVYIYKCGSEIWEN